MKQQEEIVAEFEKRYGDVLKQVQKKQTEKKETTENKSAGGVLV